MIMMAALWLTATLAQAATHTAASPAFTVDTRDYTLTVNTTGVTGVPVTVSPPDLDGKTTANTPATFRFAYQAEVSVDMAATHNGASFSSWSGDFVGQNGVRADAKMEGNRTLTAAYIAAVQEPTIVTHPQPQTVTEPNSATFTVSATGDDLSYQWQRMTGTNPFTIIDLDAYTPTYTTGSTAGANSALPHSYRVVVSNSAGSVTSDWALLTVNEPVVEGSIVVTSPTAGETLEVQTWKTISWTSQGLSPSAQVKIELLKNGQFFTTLTPATENDGVHSWYVYSPHTAPDYSIRITGPGGTPVGESARFAITDSVVLESVIIGGPVEVGEGTTQAYTLTARYSSGAEMVVTGDAIWSLSTGGTYASISSAGVLSVNQLNADQSATIRASYGGKTASKTVSLIDTCHPQFSTSSLSFGSNGGTQTFQVNSAGGCAWTLEVTGDTDGAQFSITSGSGSRSVSLTLPAWYQPMPRSIDVKIGPETLQITQTQRLVQVLRPGETPIIFTGATAEGSFPPVWVDLDPRAEYVIFQAVDESYANPNPGGMPFSSASAKGTWAVMKDDGVLLKEDTLVHSLTPDWTEWTGQNISWPLTEWPAARYKWTSHDETGAPVEEGQFQLAKVNYIAGNGAEPVILVHGLLSSADMWPTAFANSLAQDRPVYVISYPNTDGVQTNAALLREVLERISTAHGNRVVHVVSHSMGGVVTRYMDEKMAAGRLGRHFSLGSPYNGSPLADTGISASWAASLLSLSFTEGIAEMIPPLQALGRPALYDLQDPVERLGLVHPSAPGVVTHSFVTACGTDTRIVAQAGSVLYSVLASTQHYNPSYTFMATELAKNAMAMGRQSDGVVRWESANLGDLRLRQNLFYDAWHQGYFNPEMNRDYSNMVMDIRTFLENGRSALELQSKPESRFSRLIKQAGITASVLTGPIIAYTSVGAEVIGYAEREGSNMILHTGREVLEIIENMPMQMRAGHLEEMQEMMVFDSGQDQGIYFKADGYKPFRLGELTEQGPVIHVTEIVLEEIPEWNGLRAPSISAVGGVRETTQSEVSLQLSCPGATEFRIGEDFKNSTWQPMQPEMTYSFDEDSPGFKTIIAQFRDATGNVSPIVSLRVLKVSVGQTAGLSVSDEVGDAFVFLNGERLSDRTPLVMENLPPGTHQLSIHRNDVEYQEPVREITLTAGETLPVEFLLASSGGNDVTEIVHLGKRYRVTSQSYPDNSDWHAAVQAEFGQGWTVADWTDLKTAFGTSMDHARSLAHLLSGEVTTQPGGSAYVTVGGQKIHSFDRHYFVTAHYQNKPSSYLDHDQLFNNMISLGSWPGQGRILAVSDTIVEEKSFLPSQTLHLANENLNQVAVNAFGESASLADWNDILDYLEHNVDNLAAFYEEIGLEPGQSMWVTRNGNMISPYDYQYHILRGAGGPSIPPGWPNHAQLGNLYLNSFLSAFSSEGHRVLVRMSPAVPSINTHPANRTITAPNTATFSVNATGTGPLSYQWQRSTNHGSTWSNVSGATSASYSTGATSISMSGYRYRVRLSNSAGSVTSNAAILTVNPGNPMQRGRFGMVRQTAANRFDSQVFGELSFDNSGLSHVGGYSYSLQTPLLDQAGGIFSPLYGRLTPNPWNIPQWVVSEFFGLIHFGRDEEQYDKWVYSERFGWMGFVQADNGVSYLWVEELLTWIAVTSDGNFISFDFGWLVPEPGSFTHYNSRIGTLIHDAHNPKGWLRSDRFGFVWFARDGTGVWFWSSNRNEWIGITPEGGLWSTAEGRFL
jgi:pimeloyl-ACP methyl ester carboxylesterase